MFPFCGHLGRFYGVTARSKMVTHLVPLVKELHCDGNGKGHDRLLVVVQEQTGHYITRHLRYVKIKGK